jgi:uncharacterized membrane protein YgaE (UPF0421/DUF939 family)
VIGLEDKLKEWKERWNNGDTKFVPELFELVEELERRNEKDKNSIEWLTKKLAKYEQALKFYADGNGYATDIAGMTIEATVMIDKGDWAKKVLVEN